LAGHGLPSRTRQAGPLLNSARHFAQKQVAKKQAPAKMKGRGKQKLEPGREETRGVAARLL